mmetsp:Transcript_13389/g.31422  ORF Transcript_13389/g.31422 Transcript_13389/m.31422 type:complete len:377 (-) Transcript_13389:132-1262(-)
MVKVDRHILIHLALLAGQVSFGGGAIVAKLALRGKNPLVFAWLREFIAGLIMCLHSGCRLGMAWQDRKLILMGGFSMFVNHFCFIVGLSLADPISGTAWQPSQPILTCTLAVLLGLEKPSLNKSVGILISVMGALVMVLGGSGPTPSTEDGVGTAHFVQLHHLFFLINCFSASCYVLITKELLKRHGPEVVTGWCYLVGSAFMLFSTVAARSSEEWFLPTLCVADIGSTRFTECVTDFWALPPLWAIVYWIVFGSLLGYWLIAWANQYAQASIVSAYTVAQPMASCLISMALIVLLGAKWAWRHGIRPPGVQDLGIVFIVLGLGILTQEPSGQGKLDDADGKLGPVELAAVVAPGEFKLPKGRIGPQLFVNIDKVM